jgi:MFS family permease
VAPLVVPYAIFLGLLIVAALAVALVPETVVRAEERPAYRPQRVSLPGNARAEFSAAGIGAFAAFGVFGLFTSLAPSFLSGILHETSRLVAGSVVFAVFAAAVVAQVASAKWAARTQLIAAVGLMSLGLVVLAAGVLLASLPLFIVGGVVAGAGVGILFRSSVGVAASLAAPGQRGEVLAAVFLVGYAGLAVPVLLIGLAVVFFPLQAVLVVFAALSLVLVLYSGRRMIARTSAAGASSRSAS